MKLELLNIPKAKINQFHQKNIYSIEDLLNYLPKEYKDFRQITKISNLNNSYIGEEVLIKAKLQHIEVRDKFFKCYFDDNDKTFSPNYLPPSTLEVVYFHMDYLLKKLEVGNVYLIGGKASVNSYTNKLNIVNPPFTEYSSNTSIQRIIAKYSKIKGMSDKYLLDCIDKALKLYNNEEIPKKVMQDFNLISTKKAYTSLHRPKDFSEVEQAQERLTFNILYNYYSLLNKSYTKDESTNIKIEKSKNIRKIIKDLPYTLTEDQLSTVNSLYKDMQKGKKLRALIQGDVGSGKTIVAFLLAFILADNNYQTIIVAPTQTLAYQHYLDIKEYEKYGYNCFYLDSNTKTREKRRLEEGLKDGSIDILIATHSAFSGLECKSLGLVVIDEEHRFGVSQRESITKQYPNVHSITMSATPIPRSLALVSYGRKMKVYNITQMPTGRKPVETHVISNLRQGFEGVCSEIAKGRQAYIICPLIDTNEDFKAMSVEEIQREFELYLEENNLQYTFETINGKMKAKEIKEGLEKFSSGNADVLISTTIVEVGVNVPNASIIMIVNAERFGLAQLHQLRGRVGRGKYQSYCLLISDSETDRLRIMEKTTNGFEIAKADLELRGPGSLIGVEQSGESRELNLILKRPVLAQKISDYITSK
ncbi:ATP-dependent DNA helicase RecG [Peptoniphilus porci]|uniref:Probable DNA 3'-5' helicase RecG n=1 Tax=Peptoniphilus porci TaxID=2652280 RepID=A0A1U7LX52_9FIRM|nr:ATP-dependent DNA helicase RecG [Peptoniphilus porci]OLR61623.1 hypothetical protein BIV18_09725 [Peptoniphilus porci]